MKAPSSKRGSSKNKQTNKIIIIIIRNCKLNKITLYVWSFTLTINMALACVITTEERTKKQIGYFK